MFLISPVHVFTINSYTFSRNNRNHNKIVIISMNNTNNFDCKNIKHENGRKSAQQHTAVYNYTIIIFSYANRIDHRRT